MLSGLHHRWYTCRVTSPTDPPAADLARYLRARLVLVEHLITELETLDPRTLDGRERERITRHVIAIRLDTLRAERDATALVLAPLDRLTP